MAKQVIIAVRDIKADTYYSPRTCLHVGSEIRNFGDECQREAKDNLLYTHPEDFELIQIGEFETDTGVITPTEHKQIAIGSNYKR